MFFSMVLGLEEAEKSTIAIIALTVAGVVMTSLSDEQTLTANGVVFALIGAMSVGGRWPLAQVRGRLPRPNMALTSVKIVP